MAKIIHLYQQNQLTKENQEYDKLLYPNTVTKTVTKQTERKTKNENMTNVCLTIRRSEAKLSQWRMFSPFVWKKAMCCRIFV
jgi:hypothetical protein